MREKVRDMTFELALAVADCSSEINGRDGAFQCFIAIAGATREKLRVAEAGVADLQAALRKTEAGAR